MRDQFDDRPFSERLAEIRRLRGYRYVDLEAQANRVRSTAWFNSLLNSTYEGAWRVGPPSDDTLDDLARLLETTRDHVAEMVAEEWYGVKRTEQSARVAALAPRIDALTDEDAALVESLLQRLQPAGDDVSGHEAPAPPRKLKKRIKKRPAA